MSSGVPNLFNGTVSFINLFILSGSSLYFLSHSPPPKKTLPGETILTLTLSANFFERFFAKLIIAALETLYSVGAPTISMPVIDEIKTILPDDFLRSLINISEVNKALLKFFSNE